MAKLAVNFFGSKDSHSFDRSLTVGQWKFSFSICARLLEVGESASAASASLADELLKLSELRDKGVLSVEEFSVHKQKLLSQ